MRVLPAALVLASIAALGPGGIESAGEPSSGFARVDHPRELVFPSDHGAHPAFRTEWWYLTGALEANGGGTFGIQATWFRNALVPIAPDRPSNLATRDLMLFHGGFTDVAEGRFLSASRASRAASTWAGAREGDLDVWLLDDRLRRLEDGRWSVAFTVEDRRIELLLKPTRPPLLHGETPGWSRKGPDPAESSVYASHTRLEAEGTVRKLPEGEKIPVRGRLWFDHEFFSEQLADDQIGWDWFSVALDDGTDLMAFQLRGADGAPAPTSSGTLRRPDGDRVHLARGDFDLEVTDRWSSPQADPGDPPYPAGWILTVSGEDLRLRVEPLVADQEHRDTSGGPIYWEGLCRFAGERRGRPVEALGYVELVGYRAPRPRGM